MKRIFPQCIVFAILFSIVLCGQKTQLNNRTGIKNPQNPMVSFKVTSTSPVQNALNVSATAIVTVNFTVALKTSTVTSSTVLAFGEISGFHSGTVATPTSTSLTYTPTTAFKTGERVRVVLCNTIESESFGPLTGGYNFDFIIATQTAGSGRFYPDYTIGLNYDDNPNDFTAADFDKDGDIDFAVAHYEAVLRFIENTNPGYSTSDFYIGYLYEAGSIVSADFNNDGWIDLAIVVYDYDSSHAQLAIFLNAGDGSFEDAVLYLYTGTCRDLLAADFNGDGYLDIAVLHEMTSNNVSLMMNNGDGTFGAQTDYDFGDYGATSFASADFNNDGYADIAVTAYVASTGADELFIMWNNGSGSFTTSFISALSYDSRNIIAADFNDDNYMDIALSYYNNSTIAVLLNSTSTPFFSAQTEISTDNQPVLVNSLDYNADAKMDLVVFSEGNNSIQALIGAGDGTFTSASSTITKYPGQNTFTSDFNNDGILDIALIESYYDDDAEDDLYNLCVLNGFVPADEPTVQTSSLTASTVEMTYVTLQWTNGNGARRIVVATDNAALNDVPDDGIDYSADAEIGFDGSGGGSKGGGGSGRVLIGNGYVQYCGTANTLTITGLIPSHSYTFTIFEYNGTGAATNYLTSSPAVLEVETAPDRTLDVTFSSYGIVPASYGTQNTSGVAVKVLSGGKIIVGGQIQTADENNGDFGIICFNSNGTLDDTFGSGGFVVTEFASHGYDCARDILIQNIDKSERIIAVGENASPTNFALACYNTSGSLDATFGTGGKVVVNPFGTSYSDPENAVLQTDDKIIVGGYGRPDGSNNKLILVRFTAAGALDNTFDTDGFAYLSTATQDEGGCVGLQADGKILIAGVSSSGSIIIARFTPAGLLDDTFGTDGIATIDLGTSESVCHIGVQPSGMILVAVGYNVGADDYVSVIRYDSDGKIDNTFGTAGVASTSVTSTMDYLVDGFITPDGKIVLTGYSYTSPETTFVIRYNSDGTLDNTFAEDGITLTYYGSGSWGQGVTVQSDNKIVVTGGYSDGAIVYRYGAETAPLPVELVSLTASVNNNSATLNWITATEQNNYGFEVQKSVRSMEYGVNKNWEVVGFVEGSGNSNSPKEYLFTDNEVTAGNYSYRLKQIDIDGSFEYSQSIKVTVGSPKEFSLSQNYPNPFNPVTCIKYSIPGSEYVQLKVYDILGNEVSTLVNDKKEAGSYEVNFNASYLASGVYFYRLKAGAFTSIKKFVLMK